MTLNAQRCSGCGSRWFPHRLLCPRCGSHELGPSELRRGRVEEVTELADGSRVSSVLAEGEVPLIVRLVGQVDTGVEVALTTDPHADGPAAFVPEEKTRGDDIL